MKQFKKKLNLNKQTIAVLHSDQLMQIQGGTGRDGETETCGCTTPLRGCTYPTPCDC